MVVSIKNSSEKKNISELILKQLPEWFGLPESTKEYVELSQNMPFWAAYRKDTVQGFLALKENSPYTAEIFVMGVLKEYQHSGIGTALFHAFYEYVKQNGYEFIQVKTVQRGRCKEYDRTNDFYKSLGFKEFECFPSLWDRQNPCQIYIKSVK